MPRASRSPEDKRRYNLWSRYRITPEDYDRMLEAQHFQCAICCEPAKAAVPLQVDHCHLSGMVRGLLCRPCNLAIGKLGDTPEALERAAAYLRLHNG